MIEWVPRRVRLLYRRLHDSEIAANCRPHGGVDEIGPETPGRRVGPHRLGHVPFRPDVSGSNPHPPDKGAGATSLDAPAHNHHEKG